MDQGDKFEIVRYSPGHIGDLLPMWRASFEKAVGITDPHPLGEQRTYFEDQVVPNYEIRVATEKNKVVGFIAADAESIAQLYVRIGYQRRGIGSALLRWAKDQSGGSLWLYTFESNKGAQRFYERNGFNVTARGSENMWQLEDIRYEWDATSPASNPPPSSARTSPRL